jgi:UTP-glucose-1-phosphate uridylyltransferase
MDPVGPSGEFILDYSVYDAVRAGFDRVVFVIRRDIEKDFRTVIGGRIERHVPCEYVLQELSGLPPGWRVPEGRRKPWGTGHAVLTCAGAVDGPFAVINADDFYGRTSYQVLADFLRDTASDESAYGMVGFVLRNTLSDHGSVARGICRSGPDGMLEAITECTKIEKAGDGIRCDDQPLTGDEWASMNIWGFKPSIFAHLETEFAGFLARCGEDPKAEFFMPDVVGTLIAQRQATVRVLETDSTWFGATYTEDKATVVANIRALVDAGDYPVALWG